MEPRRNLKGYIMKTPPIIEKIINKQIQHEIDLLVSACERGADVFDALRVEPLSYLDKKHGNGWIRPDGTEYVDYIIDHNTNLIVLIDEEEGKDFYYESTVKEQLKVDSMYADEYQQPSGILYRK